MVRSAEAWGEPDDRDLEEAAWAHEQELQEQRRREDIAIAQARAVEPILTAIIRELKQQRNKT